MPARKRSKDNLSTYRAKRNFDRTPEPAGGGSPAGAHARRFVVQRHRARRLHYDLRFEIDGVLVSWAVPKGPTLDAGVRRAAFHVEDHPIEYFDFEGVIPAGEYGGGDVIVWDAGTWVPYKTDNPRKEIATGELHAELHGEKLRGQFVLVRTNEDKDEWLLLHKHDDAAVEGWDAEDHPKSVLTGRTNDEVQADPDRMWRSDQPAARASVALKASGATASGAELAALGAIGNAGTWQVFGRELRLTKLDAVLCEPRTKRERPVTKRDLVRYAAELAPTLLPYLRRRELTLRVPQRAPDWVPRSAGSPARLVVDEPAALVWAANVGPLDWELSSATVERPKQPTHAVLELGPGLAWRDVLVLARLHRTALEHMGLRARPKLTGTGGIEIWIPVAPGPNVDQVHAWIEQLATTVSAVVPELHYAPHTPSDTVLAPYSPRSAPGAPVSAPLDWDELDDPKLKPDRITMRTVGARLGERGELFADVLRDGQQLPRLS